MAFVPEEKLTLTDEFLDPLPVEQSVVAKIIVSKLVDVACTFRYAPMLTECIEKLKTLPFLRANLCGNKICLGDTYHRYHLGVERIGAPRIW